MGNEFIENAGMKMIMNGIVIDHHPIRLFTEKF
jgi:hypothetical protein